MFERITIIGMGLIGSSIARAAHERHLAHEIIGCDSNGLALTYGRQQGFLDTAMNDPKTAAAGSDLVILATPPSMLEDIAQAIAPGLKKGAIVMDVCSVKRAAVAAIAPHLPAHVVFIPAHPIAGSEGSGVSAGRSDLFKNKRVIVTPAEAEITPPLKKINAFWQALGARSEAMPPDVHDTLYAYVSHLPQLLAFAVAPVVAPAQEPAAFLRLCSSPHAMWIDIFTLNSDNVMQALDRYLDVITHIITELKKAPEGSAQEPDDTLAREALFPRIAASCLITTVMEAEKKAGFPFARFAGGGFADFSSPAAQPPDEDLERISAQYHSVLRLLEAYVARLKLLYAALDSGDAGALKELF